MAVKGYGATLEFENGSAGWTALARVKSIKPAKVTAADIDVTVLDSPDEFEETIAGLASGGELEATLEYSPSQTGTLYEQFRIEQGYRVRYADDSGWVYTGYLSEIGDDEVVNGEIITTTVKIKVTGKPEHEATLPAMS